MRYSDEGPQQEKQKSQQALEELEENFRPMKMAAQSHTVRSRSAMFLYVKVQYSVFLFLLLEMSAAANT